MPIKFTCFRCGKERFQQAQLADGSASLPGDFAWAAEHYPDRNDVVCTGCVKDAKRAGVIEAAKRIVNASPDRLPRLKEELKAALDAYES